MFEVGKEVVCIKSHPNPLLHKKGKTYLVLGIRMGCKCSPVLLDIGITVPDEYDGVRCDKCQYMVEGTIAYMDSSDFAPIDNTLSDLYSEELLTEIGELELINE